MTQPAWSPDGQRLAFTVWEYLAQFRDHPVSTDVNDVGERSFNEPNRK